MKKHTLNIFSLLIACGLFLPHAKMQAAVTDPIELDSAIIADLVREHERDFFTQMIKSFMVELAKEELHENRLDRKLSPPCDYRFNVKPDSMIYGHGQGKVRYELMDPLLDMGSKEAIIKDFCEGWNDCVRYLNGEYSEQQLIKYQMERHRRYFPVALPEKVDGYAAGINAAADRRGSFFFWLNPQFYNHPVGMEPVLE